MKRCCSWFIIAVVALVCFAVCFSDRPTRAGDNKKLPDIDIKDIEVVGYADYSGKKLLDADWRFHLGDAPGAEKPEFDASKWRVVDVPHDFSIEGPVGGDPKMMDGPFDKKSSAGFGGGYLNGGIGWYRKTFSLSKDESPDSRVFLQFDGVYMDSDVWLNGHHLGNHPYGYTGFEYDATQYVKRDGENILAVRVNVAQPCSRWYSGAGIFRNVRMQIVAPVYIPRWGVCVTTPDVSEKEATVRVVTQVRNDGKAAAKVELKTSIFAPEDPIDVQDVATQEVAPGAQCEFTQTIKISDVKRWSLEEPNMYVAFSFLTVNGKLQFVQVQTPFGIRTIRFTVDKGFFLNDKHVPIHGVCNHHDLGCLGAAVNYSALERQLKILKTMGCNAIRTSHNPPDPMLLSLCDRMGFLVMDEAFDEWKRNKTPKGYGRFFDKWSELDLAGMIRRDRNHPSIILWSIGNEIPEQGQKNGFEMAKRLVDICHREDPTRPVSVGCSDPNGAMKHGFAKAVDVLGINYNILCLAKYRGVAMIASESASALSTRGEYNLAAGRDGRIGPIAQDHYQVSSYDIAKPSWGATAEDALLAMKNSPWVAGEFVWTGFDYIGEPTPYQWPSRSSYFGILDICGFPKDRFFLYQSQWTEKPMVHILPHWNWEQFAGREIPVWCFTNADSVELFLNGKSLGERTEKDRIKLHFAWSVPFEPGTLKAVAKRGGKIVATDEVHTAGKPAKILLSTDYAYDRDIAFIEVRIVDAAGHLCPNANDLVQFTLRGPGRIVGLENGDPTNHESFRGDRHRVFHGLGQVVIRHQADSSLRGVELEAAAEGIPTATLKFTGK